MNYQTRAGFFSEILKDKELCITKREKAILRDYASKVMELASAPSENTKKELWYAHNSLEVTRPLVFCDPDNGWNEIIPENSLLCENKIPREWEMLLRKEIFWGDSIKDDRVIEDFFRINYIFTESDWGMHEVKHGGKDGGSYVWDAPFKSYDEDLDKIKFPVIDVDYNATEKFKFLAEETFGDILPVRLKGQWWWTLGMTWTLINLRGLEQIMYDCYDYPDGLKKLMGLLRDGTLSKLDFLEKNNLLSSNNDGTYVGSGGFGWSRELNSIETSDSAENYVRTQDMWGFCESQETSTWSPEMFEEFIFPFQLPILSRFGLNCYGCCEPLDNRWHIVEKIPNLRRVSVSPWSNIENMSEKLGRKYIYSLKPLPTDIAIPNINEKNIREKIRKALKICSNNNLEIIMKDTHTIGKNPENVIRWCKIVKEEIGTD